MKFILIIFIVYCFNLDGIDQYKIDNETVSKHNDGVLLLQSQSQSNNQINKELSILRRLIEQKPNEHTNIAGILIQILPDDKILCDGYICSEKTERCIVSIKSSKDNIHIIRQRLCLDEKAHVIDSIDDIQRNLFPGITVDYHIEQGRNTTDMIISGDYSNLYPKEPEKKPVLVG